MRVIFAVLAVLLCAGPVAAAGAGEAPQGLEDRPQVGVPVRFIDTAGFVFRPRRLVIAGPREVLAARLPEAAGSAYSEDRLDLTGLPLVGPFFGQRLAPGDAARRGELLGELWRVGEDLVLEPLEAGDPGARLAGRRLVLTAALPRMGLVSFHLAPAAFAPAEAPGATRVHAGRAYAIGDALVLAGPGDGVLIERWDRFFRGARP